jgi:hypothetical protein
MSDPVRGTKQPPVNLNKRRLYIVHELVTALRVTAAYRDAQFKVLLWSAAGAEGRLGVWAETVSDRRAM